jgi:hypothetical protein
MLTLKRHFKCCTEIWDIEAQKLFRKFQRKKKEKRNLSSKSFHAAGSPVLRSVALHGVACCAVAWRGRVVWRNVAWRGVAWHGAA